MPEVRGSVAVRRSPTTLSKVFARRTPSAANGTQLGKSIGPTGGRIASAIRHELQLQLIPGRPDGGRHGLKAFAQLP